MRRTEKEKRPNSEKRKHRAGGAGTPKRRKGAQKKKSGLKKMARMCNKARTKKKKTDREGREDNEIEIVGIASWAGQTRRNIKKNRSSTKKKWNAQKRRKQVGGFNRRIGRGNGTK